MHRNKKIAMRLIAIGFNNPTINKVVLECAKIGRANAILKQASPRASFRTSTN